MPDFSQVIPAGVGPIIVISAAGLLCLAFYNRLTAVVSRLRGFNRELLSAHENLEKAGADPAVRTRHARVIDMLGEQIEMGKRRAHLLRSVLACLLLTIICLAICALVIGLATVWRPLVQLAVPPFVTGLLTLVLGAVFALVELRLALAPIEIEAREVEELTDAIGHAKAEEPKRSAGL